MSLVSIVEALQKKPLGADDVAALHDFQRKFDIDDDDPLMVVLALMARSQILIETVPSLLQQKVNETIELHRTVLRDQAVLISKELISDLAKEIEAVNSNWRIIWIRYFCFFIGGVFFASSIFLISRFWIR